MYIAAFLLPTPVEKHLTDVGWEFDSPTFLPESLIFVLIKAFAVRPAESYLGIDVFEGDGLKLSVLRDSAGQIQNIYAQLRGTEPDKLRAALISAGLSDVQVFVPSEQTLKAG